jgi:hypothetical protein
MKRAIVLLLMVILAVSNTIGVTASVDKTIKVMADNEVFCFGENQLIVRDGRLLVPLQSGIFEKFSATTDYDHIYKEIVIRTETHLLTMYMNQPFILNKGEIYCEPDIHPEYKDGLVYVPLRAFMEALERKVEYISETHTVVIS